MYATELILFNLSTSHFGRFKDTMERLLAPPAADELRALLRLAAPTFVSSLSFYALSMLEMIFAGHLGTAEMTAVSFSQIIFDFSIIVFTQGFNKGLNALGSQAYGAKNLLLLGRYAQMGCLGVTLVTVPLALSWWFIGDLLRVFGVSPASVVLAQQYSKHSTLWLWPRLIYQYLTVYFDCQQIVLPTAIISLTFVLVHVGMNVLVVFGVPSWGWSGMGFAGLPLVMSITMFGRLGAFVLYMMWYRQFHVRSWVWSAEFFQTKYILPQIRVALDSHNSMIMLVFFLTSPIYGLGSAGVIRIGMYLGANEPVKAKQVARVLTICICCLSVAIATVLMLNRNVVGHLYSSDPRVWTSMTGICTLAASGYILLSLFYSSMVSSSWTWSHQRLTISVAIQAILVAQARALPILGIYWHIGLLGVWMGMSLGYGVTTFVAFYGATTTNWEDEAANAVLRSNAKQQQITETTRLLQDQL
ncbi:hypothetical protein DYB32_008181 [Aphanomyces invadans]|uniref:MATE efflux family protein n=1 Tax=Aphanomyces invadans TaxID=157072 RepID=A0A418ALQ0_9STRA|nr:hypothetical protein DYB32_008181 [Aphanomyces invadans]